jgi:hypothetical protein
VGRGGDILVPQESLYLLEREACLLAPGADRMPKTVSTNLGKPSFQHYRSNMVPQQLVRPDEYDELDASHSKPILDEIDIVLARDYGLTEEELDFIVNYDIKYRMGADAESSVDKE